MIGITVAKEELMFPIMERYGHDSPPKVMWGVDDQIRELFAKAMDAARNYRILVFLKSRSALKPLRKSLRL